MNSAANPFHLNHLRARWWLCAGLILLLTEPVSLAQRIKPDAALVSSKINSATYRFIKSLPADSLSAFWVLFQDKGIQSDAQYRLALKLSAGQLSERSLRRRALRGTTPSTDFSDIPVNPEYLNQLEDMGARMRVVSNWLNAASVLADRHQIEHIAGLKGNRTRYTPPTCATLRTHGVCRDMDKICRTVVHPLSYYRKKARRIQEQREDNVEDEGSNTSTMV